jgi:hypothetical protein
MIGGREMNGILPALVNSEPTSRRRPLHVIASEAKQSSFGTEKQKLDCFVALLLAMTRTQLRDLAAPFARGLLEICRPLHSEGAGNAGRPMRPIAACAMVV